MPFGWARILAGVVRIVLSMWREYSVTPDIIHSVVRAVPQAQLSPSEDLADSHPGKGRDFTLSPQLPALQ